MDFEIKLVEGGKIGVIILHASFTKELFSAILVDIIKYKKDHDINLLIYDFRCAPLNISAFEQYDCIYNLPSQADSHISRKTALWVNQGDHSYDFIETLFLNTGRLARRFEDYNDAVKWLTAEK
jgi:hypothetical protein